jgi:hypothetical protein
MLSKETTTRKKEGKEEREGKAEERERERTN